MPSVRNIFVTPNARVTSWREGGYPSTHVQVQGLLCNILCVRRVKTALEGLPGVSEVEFDPRSDTFALKSATPLVMAEVRCSVLGQVVLLWLRNFLGSASCLGGIRRKVSRRLPFWGPALKPW